MICYLVRSRSFRRAFLAMPGRWASRLKGAHTGGAGVRRAAASGHDRQARGGPALLVPGL